MKGRGVLLCTPLTRLPIVRGGLSIFNNEEALYAVLKVPRPIYSILFFHFFHFVRYFKCPLHLFLLKACKQGSPLQLFIEGLTPTLVSALASPRFACIHSPGLGYGQWTLLRNTPPTIKPHVVLACNFPLSIH